MYPVRPTVSGPPEDERPNKRLQNPEVTCLIGVACSTYLLAQTHGFASVHVGLSLDHTILPFILSIQHRMGAVTPATVTALRFSNVYAA